MKSLRYLVMADVGGGGGDDGGDGGGGNVKGCYVRVWSRKMTIITQRDTLPLGLQARNSACSSSLRSRVACRECKDEMMRVARVSSIKVTWSLCFLDAEVEVSPKNI